MITHLLFNAVFQYFFTLLADCLLITKVSVLHYEAKCTVSEYFFDPSSFRINLGTDSVLKKLQLKLIVMDIYFHVFFFKLQHHNFPTV